MASVSSFGVGINDLLRANHDHLHQLFFIGSFRKLLLFLLDLVN